MKYNPKGHQTIQTTIKPTKKNTNVQNYNSLQTKKIKLFQQNFNQADNSKKPTKKNKTENKIEEKNLYLTSLPLVEDGNANQSEQENKQKRTLKHLTKEKEKLKQKQIVNISTDQTDEEEKDTKPRKKMISSSWSDLESEWDESTSPVEDYADKLPVLSVSSESSPITLANTPQKTKIPKLGTNTRRSIKRINDDIPFCWLCNNKRDVENHNLECKKLFDNATNKQCKRIKKIMRENHYHNMREAKRFIEIFQKKRRCRGATLRKLLTGEITTPTKTKLGSKGRNQKFRKLDTVLKNTVNNEIGNNFLKNPFYQSKKQVMISSEENFLLNCQEKIRNLLLKKLGVSQSNPTLTNQLNLYIDAYVNVVIDDVRNKKGFTLSQIILWLDDNNNPFNEEGQYFQKIKLKILTFFRNKNK
ncbi:hypothetical protein M0813_10461 [Anaeramoeba flamelloides]|uniref:Uncharacterized protein n=1 Tax=Anaeramoeba flamelloides TaxID=1746091 RepID=A0ABQ8X5I3_9EUKA|nr:hypothetical protein M0813_10461 [Anaeramoeba flamelloides]